MLIVLYFKYSISSTLMIYKDIEEMTDTMDVIVTHITNCSPRVVYCHRRHNYNKGLSISGVYVIINDKKYHVRHSSIIEKNPFAYSDKSTKGLSHSHYTIKHVDEFDKL